MVTRRPLGPGERAPAFTATAWDGSSVSLADYAGRRVWLSFYRHVNCPLCNLRLHEIQGWHAGLAHQGLQLMAVFQSPRDRFPDKLGDTRPGYPWLSDPEERLYALYHLGTSLAGTLSPANLPLFAKAFAQGLASPKVDGTLTRIPGDFLIDARGLIADAFYGQKIGDHIPLARVEAFLRG
ncbi:MAG TPA: redoxin domain-containing protein [Myxococcota bacterium]|nr:redoxin domain-containing protein [Myxococcota bacterium]